MIQPTRPGQALLDGDRLLTPAEVAAVFRVDPKTVTRWASSGLLPSIRTMGGHRRFRASVVKARLQETGVTVNGDGPAEPDTF